jgi:hypothetical protein
MNVGTLSCGRFREIGSLSESVVDFYGTGDLQPEKRLMFAILLEGKRCCRAKFHKILGFTFGDFCRGENSFSGGHIFIAESLEVQHEGQHRFRERDNHIGMLQMQTKTSEANCRYKTRSSDSV